MTTQELAKDFTNLLKRNDHEGAAAKYNADGIVSLEAMDGPMAVCRGKAAVKEKGAWWQANHEVHGGSVDGPYVNGDQFVVRFTMDVTPKATGQRMTMDEIGIYTVEDANVVEARFCYRSLAKQFNRPADRDRSTGALHRAGNSGPTLPARCG